MQANSEDQRGRISAAVWLNETAPPSIVVAFRFGVWRSTKRPPRIVLSIEAAKVLHHVLTQKLVEAGALPRSPRGRSHHERAASAEARAADGRE